MAENTELLSLRLAQQGQIIDQYRMNIYNIELRMSLLIKMLEEKGTFIKEEFEKRWPVFLKNDVGIIGPDGVMEGSLKVKFYNGGV
jgi:hypothetical protein